MEVFGIFVTRQIRLNHIITILVKPVPSISSKDQIVNIEEARKVEFTCSAHGFPKPKVHWVRKSNPRKVLSKVAILVFNQIEPENDGEYLCVAKNSE